MRDLMVAALAGDAAAYRMLLDALAPDLRAYFGRRLAPVFRADTEDLVQETLLAVHSRRGTYDPARPFTVWVLAIARYKLTDYLRTRYGRPEAALDEPDLVAAEERSDDAFAERDVLRLLATVPAGPRDWIRSVRLEGQSIGEVAARTGVSVSAIKVGIHRSLKALSRKVRSNP